MLIDYLLGTNRTVLLNFAKTFTKAFNRNVYVQHNQIVFPLSVASGRFEFYELEDGMTLLLIDAVFTKEIQLISEAEHSGFYAIYFFVGKENVEMQLGGRKEIVMGNSWSNRVLFAGSAATSAIAVPAGQNFRLAVVLVHKRWLSQLLKGQNWLTNVLAEKEKAPMQFLQSLNAGMLLTIEDAFDKSNWQYTASAYLKGCVRKLLAQFYNTSLTTLPGGEHIEERSFEDVLTVIHIRQEIGHNMELAQLSADQVAHKYKMTRIKLNALFKMIYADYFNVIAHKVRMQAAVELLLQGRSILEVGRKVGYGNTSHFARTFYNTFKITPKKYQMAARPFKAKLSKQRVEVEINN